MRRILPSCVWTTVEGRKHSEKYHQVNFLQYGISTDVKKCNLIRKFIFFIHCSPSSSRR